MANRSLAWVASCLAATVLAILAGCGGSGGSSPVATTTTPPNSLALQAGTAIDPSPGQIDGISAVKGPVIFTGTDANLFNVVWCGSKKYYFYTDISNATILTANYDYAAGQSTEGSFIWPYRTGGAPIVIPFDSVTTVAKGSNLFFDITFNSALGTEGANLITLKGTKITRSPFKLPAIDFTSNVLTSVSLNDSGLALINVAPSDLEVSTRIKAIRSQILKRSRAIVGTPIERLQKLKARQNSTTGTSSTGYYLVSTTAAPIPLNLPTGAYSAYVTAINDQGISVGGAYVGDPNNPNIVPYYWDAQGNPYPLAIPIDITAGYATDINKEGSIVGSLVNGLTQYAAIWNSPNSNAVNVNAMLSPSFAYNLYTIDALGNDYTMAAEGNPKANVNEFVYLGIQPN